MPFATMAGLPDVLSLIPMEVKELVMPLQSAFLILQRTLKE